MKDSKGLYANSEDRNMRAKLLSGMLQSLRLEANKLQETINKITLELQIIENIDVLEAVEKGEMSLKVQTQQ